MKTTLQKLAERTQHAKSNQALLDREAQLISEIEQLENQHNELTTAAASNNEKMENEAPRFSNPEGLRSRLAQPFVNGDTFPPAKMDVAAAVGALLRLAFNEDRRTVLKERGHAKQAERSATETKLATARNALSAVQSQLAG